MAEPTTLVDFHLTPADNHRLAQLCGQLDEHIRQIEKRLDVEVSNRGNHFSISGGSESAVRARTLIEHLYAMTEEGDIEPEHVHLSLQQAGLDTLAAEALGQREVTENSDVADRSGAVSKATAPAAGHGRDDDNDTLPESVIPKKPVMIKTRKATIQPRGPRQQEYVASIKEHDLTFGIGPAGTGKTYLAVAAAVELLESDQVQRLVLVRPAVEAGERLGFLPGDLMQKVDPYLRPIYDALYEFIGIERVGKLVERNVIEVAPLAYMRGRTLNRSCVIMDEAQNTTVEQMKMFLTRIGFGSKAIVTGDVSQIDLPKHQLSGLKHVRKVLDGVDGIGFCEFEAADVVRHPLVQRIVSAYDAFESPDERGGQ
ncbi:MAG: PhoH family protein [Gammaproteobacteria bacterium]|nr:MAG: PhoH family protein [Gammaproteobacteria bacterium]